MKLFIYGTLKRGCKRNHLLAMATYLTDVYISSYKLIRTNLGEDSYPILVQTGDILDVVHGEVWEVPDTVVAFLEKYIEIGYYLAPLYDDVSAFFMPVVPIMPDLPEGGRIQSWKDTESSIFRTTDKLIVYPPDVKE
jgi:gamma-glutamylcyclotransferase (GGCT)/AIG2-like uncharacterized protein YtfP